MARWVLVGFELLFWVDLIFHKHHGEMSTRIDPTCFFNGILKVHKSSLHHFLRANIDMHFGNCCLNTAAQGEVMWFGLLKQNRSEKKRVLWGAEDLHWKPLWRCGIKHMPDPPCMFHIKTQNWCRTKSPICMRNDRPGKLSPELQLVSGSQGH